MAPLTILVGENSSGKSTFLALVRLAWDLAAGTVSSNLKLDFNEEPFLLGSYDQIATYRGGQAGRAPQFSIGMRVDHLHEPGDESPADLIGTFEANGSQPILKKWSLSTNSYRISFEESPDQGFSKCSIEVPSGDLEIKADEFKLSELPLGGFLELVHNQLTITSSVKVFDINGTIDADDLRKPLRFEEWISSSLGPRPYAFAPIRTRPQRTYDPLKETATPEGSHVPMILARTFSGDPPTWNRLTKLLDGFGRASGLFRAVKVRRLGRKEGDPFQIQVSIAGPPFNLMDVGYGVSQVLPIVVDCLRGEPKGTYLLQQPEVHLHPKAQAELGSFLGALAKEQEKRFVIETHSDYLLDRIRTDVREGKHLRAQDVSILYFERRNGGVHIHSLSLDETGNLRNAPSHYRRFFMEEERRFVGAK
ncbi:MAG TPA: AAA family ATPase [Thermoanaerobaculia bacterium]|nr:AAA family ATPase [Thermoanaerobaculia bacterium]